MIMLVIMVMVFMFMLMIVVMMMMVVMLVVVVLIVVMPVLTCFLREYTDYGRARPFGNSVAKPILLSWKAGKAA